MFGFLRMIMLIPIHQDSMDRFNIAVNIILQHEGGYSDDKTDAGGETNYGISLRYLKDIKLDINHDGHVDEKDIRLMTKPEAIFIYKKYWWDKFNYNEIKNELIATKTFDLSVNVGSHQSHEILQRSINSLQDEHVVVDGKLGPITFNAANKLSAEKLLIAMRFWARSFYLDLISKYPLLKKYKKGWLRRANW